jgi:hypothetical protein
MAKMSEEMVSFKITLVEGTFAPEFRRFVLDGSGGISLDGFLQNLRKLFGDRLRLNRLSGNADCKLTWTDDEGDKITIQVKKPFNSICYFLLNHSRQHLTLHFGRGMIKRSNFMRSKLAFYMRSKVFIKYCKIVQEIEKVLGALGGHYFRVFSISYNNSQMLTLNKQSLWMPERT